ncbi:hypothetical protein [Nostoc sp.]|uniref:hypothetical protein n=1 Tax=Nostoc sp. TaxID=1180 RepID=UPI002FF813A6
MPMYRLALLMRQLAMPMHQLTLLMRRLALLMHPHAMPMHSLGMLMRSPALKTLRFYAKLYLEDDFAQIQFEQITAIFR